MIRTNIIAIGAVAFAAGLMLIGLAPMMMHGTKVVVAARCSERFNDNGDVYNRPDYFSCIHKADSEKHLTLVVGEAK